MNVTADFNVFTDRNERINICFEKIIQRYIRQQENMSTDEKNLADNNNRHRVGQKQEQS